MAARNTGQTGDQLMHLGVVLHGAGAQREEARVDAVIPAGKAGEVANHVELGEFRHSIEFVADEVTFKPRRTEVGLGKCLVRGQRIALAPGGAALEEKRFLERQSDGAGNAARAIF